MNGFRKLALFAVTAAAPLLSACPPKCDASNCTGCCDSKEICHAGSELGACGAGGAACAACSAENQRCVQGACQTFCDPSVCNGCCQGTTCVTLSAQTNACGVGGLACAPCGASCVQGVCQATCTHAFQGYNNAALLKGGSLGLGSSSTNDLRKVVSVHLLGPDAGFAVPSTGYLSRSTPTDSAAYLTVKLTNMDSVSHCLVDAEQLAWLDGDGGSVVSPQFGIITGSVGYVGGTLPLTKSCLGSLETGYLIDIEIPPFDAGVVYYEPTVAVQFSLSALFSGSQISNPTAIFIPVAYDGGTGFIEPLSVDYTNEGCDAGTVGPYSTWILMDDTEAPLFWGYFASTSGGAVVPVGQSASIPGSYFYGGSGSKLLVQMDMQSASACCRPQ